VHQSTEYLLEAVGTGLGGTQALSLAATDGSWKQLLEITSLHDEALTARAALAANVPACLVEAQGTAGVVATTALPAEAVPALDSPDPRTGGSCQRYFVEYLFQHGYQAGQIQPKDFAFVLGGWTPQGSWTFHLFYIRQNQYTAAHPVEHGGIDSTERNIGHAVSNDLVEWLGDEIDTAAIERRLGKFDSMHVWAPSIVRRGLTYYMFYTGVDHSGHQRMGLATSTDLVNWEQRDEPIINYTDLGIWALPVHPGTPSGGRAQFRDPFVMEDPGSPGQWLMYFVTIPAESPGATVVGVIKSDGDFTSWFGDYGLMSTLHPYPAPGQVEVESPHAFFYQGKWWLFYTANHLDVWAISNPTSPTVLTGWDPTRHINSLIVDEYTQEPPEAYGYWKASEFLQVSALRDVAYLAAWNDQSVGISYIPVHVAAVPYLFEEDCPVTPNAVDEPTAVTGPQIRIAGGSPARARVDLRVVLPAAGAVGVSVLDASGRRVRGLADGMLPSGSSHLSWDGRDARGNRAKSGVYFVVLEANGVRRSVRAVLLH
jgi:hypothetical protein